MGHLLINLYNNTFHKYSDNEATGIYKPVVFIFILIKGETLLNVERKY